MATAAADDDDPAASSSFVTRSTVRSGHKREFDFAVRAHSQLPSSLGRTRRTSRPTTALPPPPPLPAPIPLDDAVTKRPRADRDNPTAAPPLQLNPVKPESPAPPPHLNQNTPAPTLKLKQSKLKFPTPTLGTVKLETPMEQVKLKAPTPASDPSPSPSKHKSLEPILQSNLKTPVNTQELKQSNYKPPAPPLELTPVKLKTPSPSPAGVLEPEPVKLKAMSAPLGPVKLKTLTLNGALELEQVKLKSPAARLGPVKLELPTAEALEREPEQVKPKVAGSVQEVGKSSPWELIPGRPKTPTNVEELIATGLLEGVTLKYITGLLEKKDGLKGVVKGTSILCHCASCKGLKVISAHQFEQHAGSSSNNPAAFICFENGKTIRCVLQACKLAPLGMLEVWIKSAISLDTTITCQKCNKTLDVSGTGKFASLCDSCLAFSDSTARLSLVSDCSGSTSKKISSQKITFGKLTRKDLGLHKLVFIGDTLPEGTEVSYYHRGKRILEGYIKDSGIFCLCCKSVVSPSLFEAHAGHAQIRKPYHHIYISNGVSLHELSVSLSKGRKLSASENDDLCSICADGGELLLCDLCPRAFHTDCVGLFSIPEGGWHCRYCENMLQREKYERNANAIAAGRVAGVDPLEQILKRRIQIVESPSTIDEGCVFCRCHDFSTEFGPRSVLLCDQCEREYHVGCLKDHNRGNLKELPGEEWFCSTDCSTINAALQKLIFHGVHQLHDQDSEILKRLGGKGVNITWRLLSGKILGPDGPHKKIIDRDTSSLFKGVISILHESFDAIVETETGQDLIPCMVYGRKTKTGDFGGLYCAVLIVNSSVVSTGILRVLGRKVAELPLVATSAAHQRRGYFQTLFKCIERFLASLNVKHLVLPATEEAESMWTNKFGFKRTPEDKMQEYTRGGHTMVLEGTKMLHKLVLRDSVPTEECQGR